MVINMAKKTIVLACAAGMSTSMLVLKMKTAAEEQGKDVDIIAYPVTEAEEYAEKNELDVLLLGPQVRYKEVEFKQMLKPKNVPVGVIPMMDYGMMNGVNVLAFAFELMKG